MSPYSFNPSYEVYFWVSLRDLPCFSNRFESGSMKKNAKPKGSGSDRFWVERQPTPTSCGPTCLHAIYRWFGQDVSIEELIESVPSLDEGGTLAIHMGIDALARGYRTDFYSCNLRVLDPSWFPGTQALLIEKLSLSKKVRRKRKERFELEALELYVRNGGNLYMEALTRSLLRKHLLLDRPILAGLSATFLYREAREVPETGKPDDIGGKSEGHFVVLHGYEPSTKMVTVHDPYHQAPFPGDHRYAVHIDRLINAILLGVLTHDANILVIHK